VESEKEKLSSCDGSGTSFLRLSSSHRNPVRTSKRADKTVEEAYKRYEADLSRLKRQKEVEERIREVKRIHEDIDMKGSKMKKLENKLQQRADLEKQIDEYEMRKLSEKNAKKELVRTSVGLSDESEELRRNKRVQLNKKFKEEIKLQLAEKEVQDRIRKHRDKAEDMSFLYQNLKDIRMERLNKLSKEKQDKASYKKAWHQQRKLKEYEKQLVFGE